MKRLVHHLRGKDSHSEADDEQDRLPGVTDNAAFNTDALPDGEADPRSRAQKVKEKVKGIADAVRHPQTTVQKHATKQFAVNERPWLDNQADADQELFDAHDELEGLEAMRAAGGTGNDIRGKLKDAHEHTQQVEEDREELQVAWHMARFVRRARVVRRPLDFPPTERYRQLDSNGKYQGFDWIRWIGHLILYACQDASLHYIEPTNAVPFDREVLTTTVERLLVASGAFQLWWMRVRRVYTWEDPWLTFKWFLLFLFLLKTGYFMSAYWAYLLYSVVTNYYGKHSRQWMKESHYRTNKTSERAAMFSEYIIRHGSDAWLDPFLDEMGPWLQLQLGDIADFMESACNYYDWVNVSSTTATCVNYAALFAVSAIPDLQYSMKVFWLSCGLYFFLSRPIATLYPRFRHVMDPVRWMYWDSPTFTEAAFAYLKKQALSSLHRTKDATIQHEVSEEEEDDEVFFDCLSTPAPSTTPTAWSNANAADNITVVSFPARWSGRSGRLCLSRATVSFVATILRSNPTKISSKSASVCWERPFSELLELRKASHPANRLPSSKHKPAALSILFARLGEPSLHSTEEFTNDEHCCEEELLYGMAEDHRNEAFNALIGFSGALWMNLQPELQSQSRAH